jgi:cation diffusion facilitator CzcD-associated flavoprotein CzcO
MLTAKQDNRLSAAETLYSVLRQDPAPYATDKALQAVVARLGTLIADMTPLRQQAQRATLARVAGQPTDKEAARQQLTQVAGEVAGDVFSYATDQKHATLQAVADYSQNDFARLRGSRLTDAVTALYQATQDKAYKKDLQADYDLTDARLQELQDALAAYNALKTSVRETTIDGKTARASLRTEFAELGTLLQDRLMRQLRKYERKAPAFYARVVAARQVIDRPGTAPAGIAAQL